MTRSLHFTRPGVRIDLRVSHRLRRSGTVEGGDLMLFFGARTQQELPCFSLLQSLPKDFIDSNFAFSRTPGEPKRYVQDLMRERAPTWPRC